MAQTVLTDVLDQLDSLDRDTKRESLEDLLRRLKNDPQSNFSHICVLCSSKATASYLQSSISDRGTKAWLLDSGNLPEESRRQLEGFREKGGVLISTVAMLQGLDLRYVQAIVHYDSPASAAEMHVRTTRNVAATNFVFTDQSGVFPREQSA